MTIASARSVLIPTLRAGAWHSQSDGLRWLTIDLDDPVLQNGWHVLDQIEQARAQRFRFEMDRRRYIAAHVSLRAGLSDFLGQEPAEIVFASGMHGKPELLFNSDWVFNLSHSENVAVIAVAPREDYGAIGVDVEVIRAISDLELLAQHNFTKEECDELARSGDDDALRLFLRCWTRKEACLKALGTGLTIPAQSFTAGLTAEPRNVSIDVEGQVCSTHVMSLFENEACIAAVSWCQDPAPLQLYHGGALERTSANHSTQDSGLVSWSKKTRTMKRGRRSSRTAIRTCFSACMRRGMLRALKPQNSDPSVTTMRRAPPSTTIARASICMTIPPYAG